MNTTIETQLNHKTIRKFKDQSIPQDILDTLLEVASAAATTSFGQSYSIISITDKKLKEEIAALCKQAYVATTAHLFIMVLDLKRATDLAQELDPEVDISVIQSTDRFLSGVFDVSLAAQNMMIAAESLGLGGVFLGSILNDSQKMVELLNLPAHTFPILGVGLGYPDQEPQLKPRIPQTLRHFENQYPSAPFTLESFKAYDDVVSHYYDLRDENKRIDTYSIQSLKRMSVKPEKRMKMLDVIQAQGLLKK